MTASTLGGELGRRSSHPRLTTRTVSKVLVKALSSGWALVGDHFRGIAAACRIVLARMHSLSLGLSRAPQLHKFTRSLLSKYSPRSQGTVKTLTWASRRPAGSACLGPEIQRKAVPHSSTIMGSQSQLLHLLSDPISQRLKSLTARWWCGWDGGTWPIFLPLPDFVTTLQRGVVLLCTCNKYCLFHNLTIAPPFHWSVNRCHLGP